MSAYKDRIILGGYGILYHNLSHEIDLSDKEFTEIAIFIKIIMIDAWKGPMLLTINENNKYSIVHEGKTNFIGGLENDFLYDGNFIVSKKKLGT